MALFVAPPHIGVRLEYAKQVALTPLERGRGIGDIAALIERI